MAEIEPPECPVCLQPYDDSTAVIPRVLACGHSACEVCLTLLPRPYSVRSTVRCPACTQIVNYPHPLGAAALTKNVDLLRVSLLLLDKPESERKPTTSKPTNDRVDAPWRRRFVPRIWSEVLYSGWKDGVLSHDSVLLENGTAEVGFCSVGRGKVVRSCSKGEGFGSYSPLICRMKDDEEVNLLKIGCSGLHMSVLEYGYMARVMSVLSGMSEAEREDLASVLKMSLRSDRSVCKVYGFWFDEKSGWLYLVCERKNRRLSEIEQFGVSSETEAAGSKASVPTENRLSQLAMIGSELCEALIHLQSEGFICGCLGMSCFGLDEFGHVYLDLSEVFVMGRKLRKLISVTINCKEEAVDLMDMLNIGLLPSPEILMELVQSEGGDVGISEAERKRTHDSRADAWSFGCIFINLLTGNWSSEIMSKRLMGLLRARGGDLVNEYKALWMDLVKQLTNNLKASTGEILAPLEKILVECLDYDPESRPHLTELWERVKGIMKPCSHDMVKLTGSISHEKGSRCLLLGELCSITTDIADELKMANRRDACNDDEEASGHVGEVSVAGSISVGKIAGVDLQGHRDCVTKLCIGGGMLFSSSFDKTINVWSLQDFSHVHTFKGHQHRVTAMVSMASERPLCISADIGGGIFIWEIHTPFTPEPLKTWCEPKDWRYSGIYALSAPGNEYLYTGSGDKLIKAWSLKDYTLSCSMEGHKSVVSALAAVSNVLYSGSWDGTVRLWNLHDHSSLAVLEEDVPGVISPIHCIYANHQTVVAAYENGFVKVWMDDEIKKPLQVHDGAVLAISMEDRWLFTGGWDKTVKVQEITGDQDARQAGSITCDYVITALHCGEGQLFAGFANGLIKAYNHAP